MRDDTGLVGWAKAQRAVPTMPPQLMKDGGHASLCPPYGRSDCGYRQCNNRVSSRLITLPTASPKIDRITTPANS